jgi:polar amino acid transport system substrate-binding protein
MNRKLTTALVLLGCIIGMSCSLVAADTLETIRQRGTLVWGADAEGGGPYVFADPENPRRTTGFEHELAELLADQLGVKAEFKQAAWDSLPALLGTGEIDIVLNGFELTGSRAGTMDHTVPYYIFELSLLVHDDDKLVRTWDDLRQRKQGRKQRVGVLGGSAAHQHLLEQFAADVEIVEYDGNTNAMREVETGKLDATIADNVVAIFYRDRFQQLREVPPAGARGYYVIYLRQGVDTLRAALDAALLNLLESGKLRELYQRYDLWTPAQDQLLSLAQTGREALGIKATRIGGWEVIRSRGPLLVEAAWMTIRLAVLSMPLAIVIGLGMALVRLYAPRPLGWLATGYVELLRGTPLMLQLYVLYFLLPEVGIKIPAFYAAIIGLAINYSAYEAEIYRAGLLAIPRGQMEAALALGMSPVLALRRIIVPQAMRMVMPPVTNDFIALFKDTSVCSVITVVELTKRYSIQVNDTGATLELAALTAALYLLMSIPLAQFSNYLERRVNQLSRREL